jgi:hypothetical protein
VKDPVRLLRRIAVTVVGTVILAVGVVLLVAPGPGLVVIALSLAVFAIEYQWARRHLATVQAHARSAALKAAASRVATASAVLFGVAAIGLGVVLIFTDLLPLSSAGTGVGVAIGGLTVLVTMAYSVRELRRAEKTEENEDAGLRSGGVRAWRALSASLAAGCLDSEPRPGMRHTCSQPCREATVPVPDQTHLLWPPRSAGNRLASGKP